MPARRRSGHAYSRSGPVLIIADSGPNGVLYRERPDTFRCEVNVNMVPVSPRGRRPGPPPARRAALLIGLGSLAALAVLWKITSPSLQSPVADRALRGGYVGGLSPRVPSRRGRRILPQRPRPDFTTRGRSGPGPVARRPGGHRPRASRRTVDIRTPRGPARDRAGGRRRVGRQFVLEYAFGSGHHATTFVTFTDRAKPAAREHRLTYYAQDDTLRITPGQSAEKPFPVTTPTGRDLPEWETIGCFRCHATRISASGPDMLNLDELIPNVSCERCHGPAGAHVRAARGGEARLSMPFGLGRWTASTQMSLCGQCHRHP